MEIVLIHWLIKHGREKDFELHWQKMRVEQGNGLYREILTTPDESVFDPKFKTFSIESPHYTTYINIGMWRSLADFEKAINKYFPNASVKEEGNKTIQHIELEGFEFKLRERIILKKVSDRGSNLPKANFEE